MKLTLAEPKLFKDSINVISELVNEGLFKITKNAIEMTAMDPANVALVQFKILSSAFTEYDLKEDIKLTLNMANLKQILKRAGDSDVLTLKLEDDKLKVILTGKNIRSFSLPIIEDGEEKTKVPELKFPISVTTSCDTLKDSIGDADIVDESLAFIMDNKKFTMETEGTTSSVKIEIKEDENTKITVQEKTKYRAMYAIDYLSKMIDSSKLTDTVKIQFDTNYPLRLDFVKLDKVSMMFILAPRVEND